MLKTNVDCVYGICVTTKSKKYDFESRFFNPWFGVEEDPVTGSVHTVLSRYWKSELKKSNMLAYQCSHRPGILKLVVNDEKVEISGKAKIIINGEFID